MIPARKAWLLPATALSCAMVVAGCSSSGSGSSNSTTGNSPTSASPATSGGATSGSSAAGRKGTLNVPFINDEGSTTGASYPDQTIAAQAAAQYINADLGGVNGYKINVIPCHVDGTPASTTTCANKSVTGNPVAVAMGIVNQDASIVAVTRKAGIPLFANSGVSADVLAAKGKSFIVSAPGASIGMLGLAKDLQNNNLKKAAIVYVNVPGAIASLQATASAYAKAGVTVDKYPVPYPSPDLSATFSALSEKKPDSIVLLADPTTCNAALKAAISLGLKLPVFGTSSCGSPAFGTLAKQYGSKVEITQGSVTPTGDDADAKLYQQVMAKYGKSASDVNGFQAVNGFQTIMDLYAAVKATSGDVTPATLTATLQSAKLHQFMVGPDASFQCNGTAVPASPALCSTSIDVAAYSDGKLGATTALDVSSLVG